MARYELVWSDVPHEQYRSFSPMVRAQIDETIQLILGDPERLGVYDKDGRPHSATDKASSCTQSRTRESK